MKDQLVADLTVWINRTHNGGWEMVREGDLLAFRKNGMEVGTFDLSDAGLRFQLASAMIDRAISRAGL